LQAVILAAGDGGRLGEHTTKLPKPLVHVAGRPIIGYTIDALSEAGVRDITIVVGYREEQLRDALEGQFPGMRVAFASNSNFHRGASFSVRAARPYLDDDAFLLLMADHLLSRELIASLLVAHAAAPGRSFVAADAAPHDAFYTREATKLLTASGEPDRVIAIGKQLPEWTALDTGAFVVSPAIWDALDAAPEDSELSAVFGVVIAGEGLYAADVSNAFWYDIDTAEDLAAADALLSLRAGIA
jgi:1L-myo-inositol 1-phosphate cytidylyltransferase / CDP-L-myo-inositol myo-inositolphosphotransferase